MQVKIGQTCNVIADWIPVADRIKRVKVDVFQHNPPIVFAKCRWLGPDSKRLTETYGTLFALSELKVTND